MPKFNWQTLSVQVSSSESESSEALVDEDEAEAGPASSAPDAVTTTHQLGEKVTIANDIVLKPLAQCPVVHAFLFPLS